MVLKTKVGTMGVIWVFFGVFILASGIINHDWLWVIGGFLWNLDTIDIVHWEGREY